MIRYTIRRNNFLKTKDVVAFSSEYYIPGEQRHYSSGTIEHLIVSLKNENDKPIDNFRFRNLTDRLTRILLAELPVILKKYKFTDVPLIVMVPRSKANLPIQKLQFYKTTSYAVYKMSHLFDNGTHCIKRVVDTATTHKQRWSNFVDTGPLPFPGITKKTCEIIRLVKGSEIILIDDLYTPGVNIDEDAIQALFDCGAKDVVFYSLGAVLPMEESE